MSKSTSGGTVRSELTIGKPDGYTKTLTANISGSNDFGLRYYDETSTWQYSNDGTTWADIGGVVARQEYVAVAGNQYALDGYYAQIGATYLDPSSHNESAIYTFQTILEATTGAEAYIQLYNQTDGYEITASELSTSQIVPTFLSVVLEPGVTQYFETTPAIYTVRAYTTIDGYAAICKMARIEIDNSGGDGEEVPILPPLEVE